MFSSYLYDMFKDLNILKYWFFSTRYNSERNQKSILILQENIYSYICTINNKSTILTPYKLLYTMPKRKFATLKETLGGTIQQQKKFTNKATEYALETHKTDENKKR